LPKKKPAIKCGFFLFLRLFVSAFMRDEKRSTPYD